LASVSVFAWSYGNAFNGTVFGLGTALLATLGAYAPSPRRIEPGGLGSAVAGALVLVLGWVYPTFGDFSSWWRLAIEAPVGVIPCPTLLVVIGLALLGGGLGSEAWSLALAALGFFYGVFGAQYLGVAIDWVLSVGAVLLAWVALPRR
jgi:hypothetical protein